MAIPAYRIVTRDRITINRGDNDIIECAFNNDFGGVDAELAKDPHLINAQRTESGITPLMAAAGTGLSAMVDHLINKEGIDFYCWDHFGNDALDHGRRFPQIVSQMTKAMYPDVKWQEPEFKPL